MKRMLILFIWLINFSGAEKASKYIIFDLEENVRILIPRENYLEHKEFIELNEKQIKRDSVRDKLNDDIEAYNKFERTYPNHAKMDSITNS